MPSSERSTQVCPQGSNSATDNRDVGQVNLESSLQEELIFGLPLPNELGATPGDTGNHSRGDNDCGQVPTQIKSAYCM